MEAVGAQDRIECAITIDAPLERVWHLVSEPGWWVPTTVESPDVRTPGHRTVRETEKWGTFEVEVVEMRPQTYAAFRWASQFPGQAVKDGNSTMVEFFVEPVPGSGSVSVTVVESGFAGLDADEAVRKAGVKDNSEGWPLEMAELKQRAEEQAA
ncbi:MAG TPA: SRPBCC domain-containing protein [Actinocrinis sp.]|jgi:uncharacterized protein YndB with AHSA1/START domain